MGREWWACQQVFNMCVLAFCTSEVKSRGGAGGTAFQAAVFSFFCSLLGYS